MKFTANDALVEALALQVAALRIALAEVVTALPEARAGLLARAEAAGEALQAQALSDQQIARIQQVLRELASPPG